jgi:cobalamin biosynthesis Mg chelatase CobN
MLLAFFAAVGATARVETLLRAGPAVLAFTAVALGVHCAVAAAGTAAANRYLRARHSRRQSHHHHSRRRKSGNFNRASGDASSSSSAAAAAAGACAGAGAGASSSEVGVGTSAAAAVVELDELLVASNANIGGPATAASFAGLIGRPDLVAPAAAWGTVGYGVATFLGCRLCSALLGSAPPPVG